MTQFQWQQLEATIAGMTADERARVAALLDRTSSAELHDGGLSLGLFADQPELIDDIMKSVYHARENHPLRLEQ
jgi:hypothetical protein